MQWKRKRKKLRFLGSKNGDAYAWMWIAFCLIFCWFYLKLNATMLKKSLIGLWQNLLKHKLLNPVFQNKHLWFFTSLANTALLLGCAYKTWIIRNLSGRTVKKWLHLTVSSRIILLCLRFSWKAHQEMVPSFFIDKFKP